MTRLSTYLRLTVALWLAALGLLAACDATAIDPFQESDLHFSLFGFLDASADTQFIRVSTLRDSIATEPTPLDAVIVLEHRGTGEQITWMDSLFAYANGNVAHNFWSPQRMEPGATYRLTAMRSDGASSSVTFILPDTPSDLILDTGASPGVANPQGQAIVVEGVDALADVQMRYLVPTGQGTGASAEWLSVSYLPRVARFANGRLAVGADLYQDLRARIGAGCPTALDVEVFIAAKGPGWPDFLAFDPETLALPGVVGNVEHGVGFVGGVATQVRRWPELASLFQTKRRWCESGCLSFPLGC